MAFPWKCICDAQLATAHIVEDLKLGIDLTRSGYPPLFCPEALVTSVFPLSRGGVQEQRTRWEHGHLGVILSEAPRLFLHSLFHLDAASMGLAFDLSVPPLALLTLQVLLVWFASAAFYATTKLAAPLEITTVAGALLAIAVLFAWARFGRHIVGLHSLASAPVYALRKVPLYLKFVAARQVKWTRSSRGPDGQERSERK
jgi:cellulose synthase/poly-beta-1,6-N-acetylglucosamine synthase-like glycosyltransferase